MNGIKDINIDDYTGQLLIIAISQLTGFTWTNITPDAALRKLDRIAKDVFGEEYDINEVEE